ncbi:sulfurtransferase TusA family protein [Alkalimarinus sediminis]|uniref:Sulfurtransferase TusA family protein n=1 Tax=Alkalimarinus sediminis TaxID=1632866 RepID=A0A9E8HU82_9ALTE|nr:sulfurtransferase TusA family protein [Alkalimarinus sediminis]UZW75824.1 sulfurtransferase TusA family protein [Alkalimarinus sediminis]
MAVVKNADKKMADQVLDVTGLNCPMPLLKAKQALNKLSAGQTLLVKATDPGSVRDFKSFTELSTHQLLESYEENDCFCYLILKND